MAPNIGKMKALLTALASTALLLYSCKKDDPVVAPPDPFDAVSDYLTIAKTAPAFDVALPSWLSEFTPTITANPNHIELGRVIFYDKHLSADGKIACASCHQQAHAFADNKAFSDGVNGRKTKRNSLALLNNPSFGGAHGLVDSGTTYYPLFWDSRAFSIQMQSRMAFTNPNEMDISMENMVKTVAAQPYYPWLFQRTYGDSAITEGRILESIAYFLNALSTHNSKFDQAMAAQSADGVPPPTNMPFTGFTAEENQGKALYLAHCEVCHGSLDTPRGVFEANNGLESPYVDKGKGGISGLFYENGTFKVPMLRNIANSAPYMHDGRFDTLEKVIEHYNSGIVQVFGLHGDLLQYNPDTHTYSPKRLHLTEQEKAALKAFLLTLSDDAALTDARFADPFR